MSKPLGIGDRVYIGWTTRVGEQHKQELCRTGTIFSGPFRPLELIPDGRLNTTQKTIWVVAMDSGLEAAVAEPIIFPIDDDDPETTDRPVEKHREEVT